MSLGEGDNETSQRLNTAKQICLGLQSADKKQRKQTYVHLQNFLSEKFSHQELRNMFNETHMYTLNGFRDKSEAVREQAIIFMCFLIIEKLPLNDYYLTYVFPVLVERIGTVELIEESEEIRLLLVQFLEAIVLRYSKTDQLKPFLNDIVIILCEVVKDKYPAIKELACKCITEVSRALPTDFHMQAECLVKPVASCFTNQRFKVRVEAVKCMGDIIMSSSYKGLEEALTPMAERLFDQIPVVRRTVAQVAGRWLLEYRDRYSFFHKLLPLILTGLNDEVPETRAESEILWEKIGLQYQQENENDLKDKLDFLIKPPKYYLEHLTRPNLGCRVLVQRNIGKIAPALSFELQSWQPDIRVRCSQLLCSVALCAEEGLTMHLQTLFPAMYFAAKDEDQRVVMNIEQASEILGLFVPVVSWWKLLLPVLENGPHYGQICVLSNLIKGVPQEYIGKTLEEICKNLADDSVCYSRKKQYQKEMVKCANIICSKCSKENDNSEVAYCVFKIIISMVSLRDKENQDITVALLENLQKALNLNGTEELWIKFLPKLLKDIQIDPKSWTVVTYQRCIFETVLLESGVAFGGNLELIGDILKNALDLDADPESRLKTFWALSSAFENKDVIFRESGDNLTVFLEGLITDVFVPSLIWHAGLTAEALRTMAVSCLRSALMPAENVELFCTGDVFRPLFDNLLPLLMSLVEDASYKSRQLAMECIVLLKQNAVDKNIWVLDDLIKIYPEILKRLDDPTDKVRLTALNVLPILLKDCPNAFLNQTFKPHHELLIDTLLTHYDDDESTIRNLVFEVWKVIAEFNPQFLAEKMIRSKSLLRNQEGCDEVLRHLKELNVSL